MALSAGRFALHFEPSSRSALLHAHKARFINTEAPKQACALHFSSAQVGSPLLSTSPTCGPRHSHQPITHKLSAWIWAQAQPLNPTTAFSGPRLLVALSTPASSPPTISSHVSCLFQSCQSAFNMWQLRIASLQGVRGLG